MERGTMQYYTEAGLKEIKSQVLSLSGVTRCSLDTDESGALQAVRVAVRSGWSPIQVAKEISSHLESTLEVKLAPERVLIEVDESADEGGDQGGFFRGSAGRGSTGTEGSPDAPSPEAEARSGTDRRESERRRDERRSEERRTEARRTEERRAEERREEERRGPERRNGERATGGGDAPPEASTAKEEDRRRSYPVSADPRTKRRAPEAEPGPSRGTPKETEVRLDLREFGVFGGRGAGVELRVRLGTSSGIKEGAARARDLESVTPALFVDTALRAAELAMDEVPVDARSERILILEAEEVEEVEMRAGRFMAVTVRALRRRGALRATGLYAARGGRCEDAVRAAMDAVIKLLEGRGESPERDEDRHAVPESGYDPFSAWD